MILQRKTIRWWPGVMLVLASIAGSAFGGTSTPHLLPLQGRVTDPGGTPLASADLVVRIFDAPTSSGLVYDSGLAFTSAVDRGLFAVTLGESQPLLLDNTISYWLEIEVDGDEIVGDAASGRLEFYPGGGDHDRPDLELRLSALETELGLKSTGEDLSEGTGSPRDKAAGDFLANGQLGLGAFQGSSMGGSVVAIMPNQAVGAFATASHQLRLKAIQVFPTTGPVTIVIDASPDSLGIGWHLIGPAALDSTGTGDAVLTDLNPGTYILDWLDYPGWYHACVDPEVINVPSDSTATFACTYLPGVTVVIDPEPDSLNAGWLLNRPGLPDTSASGDAVLHLGAAGSYTLTWMDDPCWVAPLPNPVVLIGAGLDTVQFDGLYHSGPDIISVIDVGNDQGRNVRVKWKRSCFDAVGDSVDITGYALYRRQDAFKKSDPGQPSGPRFPGDKGADWDYLETVPARLASTYQYVAPTLCDSTAESGVCWSVFMVTALTTSIPVFFDSYPDSGYSVDNLAPGAPTGFSAAYGVDIVLNWNSSPEPDFQYFLVYRGIDPGFTPDPQNLVYSTADTTWSDPEGLFGDYYKISAVDFAGNESPSVSPGEISGVASGLPSRFSLGQNRPNPFNPVTTIVFDLPRTSTVNIDIYDVSGRLVRNLMSGELVEAGTREIMWYGRNNSGRQVPSGPYFYRLETAGYSETRRMTLIK